MTQYVCVYACRSETTIKHIQNNFARILKLTFSDRHVPQPLTCKTHQIGVHCVLRGRSLGGGGLGGEKNFKDRGTSQTEKVKRNISIFFPFLSFRFLSFFSFTFIFFIFFFFLLFECIIRVLLMRRRRRQRGRQKSNSYK